MLELIVWPVSSAAVLKALLDYSVSSVSEAKKTPMKWTLRKISFILKKFLLKMFNNCKNLKLDRAIIY